MNRQKSFSGVNQLKFFLLNVTIVICLGTFSVTPLLWAHDESGGGTSPDPSEVIKPLTIRTLQLLEAYQSTSPHANQNALQQLEGIVNERHQMLLELMENNPSVVLEVTLPEAVANRFPASLQDKLEHSSLLEGDLQTHIIDNFENMVSKVEYVLSTDTKERIILHFAGDSPLLDYETRVLVKGTLLDNHMAVLPADGEGMQVLQEPAVALATDVRKVAVILINFLNDPTQSWTVDTVRGILYSNANSVDEYYKELSFGKMSVEGLNSIDGTADIFGWYTIPYNNTPCSYSTWADAAQQAAGINDQTGYYSIIYAFPRTSACGWSGLGTLGGGVGNSGASWINGSFGLRTVAHELGHNFKMHHSSSYRCTDSTGKAVFISSTCTLGEYGDPYDVMGGSASNHVNIFQKGRLNVLQSFNTYNVTQNGIYTIRPLEYTSTGIQSLRIPREFDATGKPTKYFYLEYRQPYGQYFDNFSTTSPVVNGVSIHLAPDYTVLTKPLLLDATPGTSSFSDAPLGVSQIIEDPIGNITVKTLSVASSGADVEISLGPITCNLANPTVSISPSSQWGFPGDIKAYNVTVSNNNSSICNSATFDIIPTLPVGWSQSPVSLTETLASGTGVTRTINVTSAVDAVPNFYTIVQTATNSANSSYSSSASAQYVVQQPDTTAPTVTITNPTDGSTISGNKITIAATATDNIAVDHVTFYIDGVLKVIDSTAPYSYSWSTRNVASGSHIIQATAFDSAGNSASHSITVIKSSTTGGKGSTK